MRAIRVERNLSIEGVAAALPDPHHFTWVSKVERNEINLKLSDLYGLATALRVDAGWLVSGDAHDSEFMSRMRGYEQRLDHRGQRSVLALAEQQSNEDEALRRRLRANGLDEATIDQVLRAAPETDRGSDEQRPA